MATMAPDNTPEQTDSSVQFEAGYILRSNHTITFTPDIAFAEFVVNAWDGSSSNVKWKYNMYRKKSDGLQ